MEDEGEIFTLSLNGQEYIPRSAKLYHSWLKEDTGLKQAVLLCKSYGRRNYN
jgi:hypothetical protein